MPKNTEILWACLKRPFLSIILAALKEKLLNFDQCYKEREKFDQYRERFESYTALKGITTDLNLVKQTFINSIGSELDETIKSLSAPKTISELSYKEVADSLQLHLCPPPNTLVELHRFLSRVQIEADLSVHTWKLYVNFCPTANLHARVVSQLQRPF